MLGKLRKPSENLRMLSEVYEYFYNIPISDTCGLKIRFNKFDCKLHWYYAFCTGITLFALVLLFNCTALGQSESSNFFMYVIKQEIQAATIANPE